MKLLELKRYVPIDDNSSICLYDNCKIIDRKPQAVVGKVWLPT